MLMSAMMASSIAATSASPLCCDPETAREKRRRNGRCGAIVADRLMMYRLPQMTYAWLVGKADEAHNAHQREAFRKSSTRVEQIVEAAL